MAAQPPKIEKKKTVERTLDVVTIFSKALGEFPTNNDAFDNGIKGEIKQLSDLVSADQLSPQKLYESAIRLGKILSEFQSKNVELNNKIYEGIFNLLSLAAEQGFAPAEYELGEIYAKPDRKNGNYPPQEKDMLKAIDYFVSSADKGFADAQYRVGKLYMDMRPYIHLLRDTNVADKVKVGLNLDKSLEYCKLAADQGHAVAAFQTGIHYACVKDDLPNSIIYIQRAVKLGNIDAIKELASYYARGLMGTGNRFLMALELYTQYDEQYNEMAERNEKLAGEKPGPRSHHALRFTKQLEREKQEDEMAQKEQEANTKTAADADSDADSDKPNAPNF